MLENPEFWVALGFVILVTAGAKLGARAVGGMLDQRSARIRGQIEEAERLRAEARGLLEAQRRRHAEALKEAEAIVARAHEEARRIAVDAAAALETALQRREQQTLDKIAQAEAAALRAVRYQAVEVAVAAVRRIVASEMQGERGGALIDAAIQELPGKLH